LAEGGDRTVRKCRAWAGHLLEEGGPDRWGPPVGGRREREDTLSGFVRLGLGPDWGMGRIVPLGHFPIFFISFSFLFLVL
jgi:hypothetical protein